MERFTDMSVEALEANCLAPVWSSAFVEQTSLVELKPLVITVTARRVLVGNKVQSPLGSRTESLRGVRIIDTSSVQADAVQS